MSRMGKKIYQSTLFSLLILLLVCLQACHDTLPAPTATHPPFPTITKTVASFVPSATPELTLFLSQVTSSPTLSPSATLMPTSTFHLCSPLAWETIPELWEIISDPYNPPPPGSDERHQGVDFSHYSRKEYKTIEGEPVQVILSGRVAASIQNRLPYGNMVIIETGSVDLPVELRYLIEMAEGESLYLLYAHFGDSPLVKLGETVQCGQVIGEVGATGYNIVNPHLHLEARLGPSNISFDSMAFYTTSATEQEMENYKRWRTSGEFRHFDPMKLFEFVTISSP